jgi:hypothetical protein
MSIRQAFCRFSRPRGFLNPLNFKQNQRILASVLILSGEKSLSGVFTEHKIRSILSTSASTTEISNTDLLSDPIQSITLAELIDTTILNTLQAMTILPTIRYFYTPYVLS